MQCKTGLKYKIKNRNQRVWREIFIYIYLCGDCFLGPLAQDLKHRSSGAGEG